jgi:hypothetical protein
MTPQLRHYYKYKTIVAPDNKRCIYIFRKGPKEDEQCIRKKMKGHEYCSTHHRYENIQTDDT